MYIYIYIRIHVYYVICVFLHRYITYASRIFHRIFNVFFKQRRTPLRIWAGSVPHWGVWLTIVRWVCIENSNTKSPPGVHSPDRGLSQAKPVLGSHVYFFGWLAMPPPVNEHHWMASQNESSNSVLHIRFGGGGFPGSWAEHRFCLTSYESGCGHQEGDFVLRFSSHTHRTIVSQTPSQEQIQLRPAEKCLAA